MTGIDRRTFLAGALAAGASLGCDSGSRLRSGGGGFVCPPCGCAMDGHRFDAPGICPACGMTLAPADEAALGFEPAELPSGAGRFQVRGGGAWQDRRITVHYYRPEGFTPRSDILLVVPGSGRNSGAYRNAWLEPSIRSDTLVAALGYPESDYDFAAYHLGGIAAEVDWRNARIDRLARSTVVHLEDEDIEVRINRDASTWLFNDFDRIFGQVRAAAGSVRHDYDLFGHSAGAQVLHRMVLLHGPSAARRRAAGLGAPFQWQLQLVPGTGHDHRAMSAAAARLLFPE